MPRARPSPKHHTSLRCHRGDSSDPTGGKSPCRLPPLPPAADRSLELRGIRRKKVSSRRAAAPPPPPPPPPPPIEALLTHRPTEQLSCSTADVAASVSRPSRALPKDGLSMQLPSRSLDLTRRRKSLQRTSTPRGPSFLRVWRCGDDPGEELLSARLPAAAAALLPAATKSSLRRSHSSSSSHPDICRRRCTLSAGAADVAFSPLGGDRGAPVRVYECTDEDVRVRTICI